MTFCANCGVELDDGYEICPLCGKSPGNNGEQEHLSFNYPSYIIQLHRKENRKYLWELSGIITFSSITVCTIVDLITSKGLSWSLFSDVIVLAAWVILTLFLHTYKQVWVIIPGLMLTILATLFIIDLIASGSKWFFPVGLPLTIAAFTATSIVMILYKSAHLKGLNIVAAAFLALSGFCIITEMILDKYLDGFVDLRWSLIVAVSVLPVALIFFYYHYRLKKGIRLDSFFHI